MRRLAKIMRSDALSSSGVVRAGVRSGAVVPQVQLKKPIGGSVRVGGSEWHCGTGIRVQRTRLLRVRKTGSRYVARPRREVLAQASGQSRHLT